MSTTTTETLAQLEARVLAGEEVTLEQFAAAKTAAEFGALQARGSEEKAKRDQVRQNTEVLDELFAQLKSLKTAAKDIDTAQAEFEKAAGKLLAVAERHNADLAAIAGELSQFTGTQEQHHPHAFKGLKSVEVNGVVHIAGVQVHPIRPLHTEEVLFRFLSSRLPNYHRRFEYPPTEAK